MDQKIIAWRQIVAKWPRAHSLVDAILVRPDGELHTVVAGYHFNRLNDITVIMDLLEDQKSIIDMRRPDVVYERIDAELREIYPYTYQCLGGIIGNPLYSNWIEYVFPMLRMYADVSKIERYIEGIFVIRMAAVNNVLRALPLPLANEIRPHLV